MKKLATILILTITICANAQKLEKIKGSKNVILSERVFEELTSLELHKDINLTMMSGTENKLEIYADDNLHDVVDTELVDGKLDIFLTNKISGKKNFELTLHLTDNALNKIVLNENSKLKNVDFLNVADLEIELNDKSNAKTMFSANTILLTINDHAKGVMAIKGDQITYNLQETAKLKVTSNVANLIINCEQKATITLTGKADDMQAVAKNSSKIKASNLRVKNANLTTENNANIYINASDDLNIKAESKSKIYIYGNPTIAIESFKGTASLLKKE